MELDKGLSALKVARTLMDNAGQNISNAATDGYHARRVEVTPQPALRSAGKVSGEGARVQGIKRLQNQLTERALRNAIQARSRLQELERTLGHLESVFAEPSDNGLNSRLSGLFSSLSELTSDPGDPVRRREAVLSADAVTDGLNRLTGALRRTEGNVRRSLQDAVAKVNRLSERVAGLNQQISVSEPGSGARADLQEQRSQALGKLSKLLNFRVVDSDSGTVNVSVAGTLLVDGNSSRELAVRQDAGTVDVVRRGGSASSVPVREGEMRALMDVANDRVPELRERLNTLANGLRRSFNRVHTTGLGGEGRFGDLSSAVSTGGTESFAALRDAVEGDTDARLHLNLENSATGEVTRKAVTLDTTASADQFVNDFVSAINGISHLSAANSGGKVRITADDSWEFGFATQYDPTPALSSASGSPPSVGVRGRYTGGRDLTYKVEFDGSGTVGEDAVDMTVDVRDQSGNLVRTLHPTLPADYSPGTTVNLEHGLQVSLGEGTVSNGDTFTFTARADNDPAGILSGLGLNTLFEGKGAHRIDVVDRVKEDPTRFATALRPEAGDGGALRRMQELQEGARVDGLALPEYYRDMVSTLGARKKAVGNQASRADEVVRNLKETRDRVSGASLDEEMVHLLSAQRMYQVAGKYVKVARNSFSTLLGVL